MQDAIYYAYFAPYSYERHQDLIAKSISSKQVRLEVLGETLDGHDIDLLQIGEKLCVRRWNSMLHMYYQMDLQSCTLVHHSYLVTQYSLPVRWTGKSCTCLCAFVQFSCAMGDLRKGLGVPASAFVTMVGEVQQWRKSQYP